jgi:hypothetical protein
MTPPSIQQEDEEERHSNSGIEVPCVNIEKSISLE